MGLISSPMSDGLTRRVIGPCLRPLVRKAMPRWRVLTAVSCRVAMLSMFVSLRCLRPEICSGPGGEVGRLPARDLVREGNAIAPIRAQVGMGLEISECLRHFARPGEQAGEGLLWDLLE